MKTLVYNAIRTPDGTVLESRHCHDYVTHVDKNGKEYILDGGLDYVRRSINGDEVLLQVYMEDGHEKVREFLKWGTRGIKGDEPLRYIPLKDMTTDHIQACLDTQSSMRPCVRESMETELKYRNTYRM